MKYYLSVVLLCISLKASDAEHLFICLWALFGEVSVQVLCPFFNWVVCLPGVELCEFFIYFASTLLVGLQTGAATVQNSMEFPQKTKNGTAF